MHRSGDDGNSWAPGPSPRQLDEIDPLDRDAATFEEDEDPLDTHVTMDTLIGTSHYIRPSPHRLEKARRAQASSSQPSLTSDPTLRKKNPKRNKQYPFNHRIKPAQRTIFSRKRATSHKRVSGDQRNSSYSLGSLHMMAPLADTPAVASDAGKLLWREWTDGKKLEATSFDSMALELESRMARAAVLSRRHGRVNSLRTAVAFDCLDQLGRVFGQYGSVFKTIRAELEKSIYVDGNISTPEEAAETKRKTTQLMDAASAIAERSKQRHLKNKAKEGKGVEKDDDDEEEDEDHEVLYGQRLTYFEQAAILEIERKRIMDMASHLQMTLEDWEVNKAQEKKRFESEAQITSGQDSQAAHVWAEILQKGRHEKHVATLLSRVSRVHAHFKGKIEQDEGTVNPSDSAEKVVAAFKHLSVSQQTQCMNSIISEEDVSRHLLKKTFEACLARLDAKRICRSVAKEISKPERVHSTHKKMKVRGQEVQLMYAQTAHLLSHDAKIKLQLQILHSLADDDADEKKKIIEAEGEGKGEDKTDNLGDSTRRSDEPERSPSMRRVKSVCHQAELLGDSELDELFASLGVVPLKVAETSAREADALRQRLCNCRDALQKVLVSLKRQTKVIKGQSEIFIDNDADETGTSFREEVAAIVKNSRDQSKSVDVEHASRMLLRWLASLAAKKNAFESSGSVHLEDLDKTTLWGGMQDGTMLSRAIFTLLLSRAMLSDAAAAGNPPSKAALGKCWSKSKVIDWKRRANEEVRGSLALLRDHVFPALVDTEGGLGVPNQVASPALIHQADPDAALRLATFIFCRYAGSDLSILNETSPEESDGMRAHEPSLEDDLSRMDNEDDGDKLEESAEDGLDQEMVREGVRLASSANDATDAYIDAQHERQTVVSVLLGQYLVHEFAKAKVQSKSPEPNEEAEARSPEEGPNMAQLHELERMNSLVRIKMKTLEAILTNSAAMFPKEDESGLLCEKGVDCCLQEINSELSSAAVVLSQVFRHYCARSQTTSGASRLARKDFVQLIKDSKLFSFSIEDPSMAEYGAVEEAAATKISALARGKRDRKRAQKVASGTGTPGDSSLIKSKNTKKKDARLSARNIGKRHAEKVFDDVLESRKLKGKETTIGISGFAEALVRFSFIRFAESHAGTRLTLHKQVCLLLESVCQYARRSDVDFFKRSVIRQDGVQELLFRFQDKITDSFRQCVSATRRHGTRNALDEGKGSKKKGTSWNTATFTTLRDFENWLDTKARNRPGSPGAQRSKQSGLFRKIGKREARGVFAYVQQLDWADGSITDDTEMSIDEFREALVALSLYIDPSPFHLLEQRVERGLLQLLK